MNCVGIVTARDKFAIDFDKDVLKRRIEMFRNLSLPDEFIKKTYPLKDTSTFKFTKSRGTLSKDENWGKYFTKILYRPFDKRNIYYTKIVIERPLLEVMHHMMHENLGLVGMRQYAYDVTSYNYVFVTNSITESRIFISNRGIASLFPLYLYPRKGNSGKRHSDNVVMLFEPKTDYGSKRPNLSPVLIEQLSESYKKTPTPEQILFYIYGVLYSNTYRTKYAEFLKIDFPRIPFTESYKIFSKMAKYGERLVALHLLKSTALDLPVAKFRGRGNKKVEKVRYEKERVYINENQYFDRIKQEIWEYQIGGYQVCAKWLKDRKGRQLSLDDIKHYCNIVTALKKTMEIQKKIDKIYPEVEKKTVDYMHNTDQN